jgi:hypothetical protein
VICSASHMTGSRIRQVCIKMVSNPRTCPPIPSQRRWEWTRSISSRMLRM